MMHSPLRIPSSFPPTNVRSAFGRDWIWPAEDVFGWSHPLEHWPEIDEAIQSVFPYVGQEWTPERPYHREALALQCGGCCGMYPWLLSRHFERVLTFELDPFNFSCLVRNCPSPRIIAANLALGAGRGMVGIDRRSNANCGNHHVQHGDEIPMISTDDLGLPRLDALFLDAESWEEYIINGAYRTLTRCRPRLITVETVTDSLVSWLKRLGYAHSQPGYDHLFVRNLAQNLVPPAAHGEGEPFPRAE